MNKPLRSYLQSGLFVYCLIGTEMNKMLMILFRHGLHGFHGFSVVIAQSYRVIRVIRA